MELSSKKLQISKIKKKTSAKVFEDFEVGDVISFHIMLDSTTGASGGGTYVNTLECYNHTQGMVAEKSQNNMLKLIRRCFELTPHNNKK